MENTITNTKIKEAIQKSIDQLDEINYVLDRACGRPTTMEIFETEIGKPYPQHFKFIPEHFADEIKKGINNIKSGLLDTFNAIHCDQ